MRSEASILHLDLDAFFAAVEQRDKPSLRGRPVVVGGVGLRGVVATASYEARRFGVRSAMSTAEARARCPQAAFLSGRFDAYRQTSDAVMAELRALSTLVEPLSLDEAYVDLVASPTPLDLTPVGLAQIARRLKDAVTDATGGLTASVGIASSKLVAKIASELDKPDGTVVVPPGSERDLLRPMQVTVIPGVGPATAERLRRIGVHTVAELETVSVDELERILGRSQGASLFALARARDDRPVVSEREAKSVSVEDTFEHDLVDPAMLAAVVDRHASSVCARLHDAKLSGRTVTLKVRLHDFSTHTRSATLPGPTDRATSVSRTARALLAEVDTASGVRLLGVGVSGLSDWIQDDLFAAEEDDALAARSQAASGNRAEAETDTQSASGNLVAEAEAEAEAQSASGILVPEVEAQAASGDLEAGSSGDAATTPPPLRPPTTDWRPGMDVDHADHGPGWVWGSGLGRVTVRFETAETGPGPVRTFAADDPSLVKASARRIELDSDRVPR